MISDGLRGVGLDARAQPLDVHVEGLGVADVVGAPDPVDQHVAGQHPAGVLDQQAAAARTPCAAAGPPRPARRPGAGRGRPGRRRPRHAVSSSPAADPSVRAARRPPSGADGPHPGHQLAQAVGLGHVVVGPDLEGDDGVDLGPLGRHHDDGHRRAGRGSNGRRRCPTSWAASGRAGRGRATSRRTGRAPRWPSRATVTRKPSWPSPITRASMKDSSSSASRTLVSLGRLRRGGLCWVIGVSRRGARVGAGGRG